jgi:hypothetical protein
MWLFTRYGFFSAVYDAGRKRMALRARVRQHLERLMNDIAVLRCEVIETLPPADYRYRIMIDLDNFDWMMAKLSQDIDYPNFKNACKDAGCEPEYLSALHDVWMRMNRLQAPSGTRVVQAVRSFSEGERIHNWVLESPPGALDQLSVRELRKLMRFHGFPTRGRKTALIDFLVNNVTTYDPVHSAECPESPDGKHDFTPDAEYDAANPPLTCEYCGAHPDVPDPQDRR